MIRFAIPLLAAHALLEEAVFARASDAGTDAIGVEFEDSDSVGRTQSGCDAAMSRSILAEVRRLGDPSQGDTELSVALTEAAIVIRRALSGEGLE